MIDDLDEALKRLLIKEIPIKNNEIDIQFKQPKREWSARLSRPTLNIFLYDLRENVKLRQHSPQWIIEDRQGNKITQRRAPIRMDFHYAITAWATEPEDEHSLLARTLLALYRNSLMPEDVMPDSILDSPGPVQFLVAQPDMMHSPSDFWSAIDNEIRPTLICTVVMAINPFYPIVTPIVSQPPKFGFADTDSAEQEDFSSDFWEVKGILQGLKMRKTQIRIVENNTLVKVQRDGKFTLPRLKVGEYTLEIAIVGQAPITREITVPSEEYTIDLSNDDK